MFNRIPHVVEWKRLVTNRQLLNRWVNFCLFNALWPVCVIGAANDLIWPALVLTTVYMLWQWHPAHRAAGDVLLVLVCVTVGTILDSLWVQLGWLRFATPWPFSNWAPVWIAALWVGFALALNHSLAWLQQWPRYSALGFVVVAPFSYAMAQQLGAVTWLAPWWYIVPGLGVSWAILIFGLLLWARRWRSGRLGFSSVLTIEAVGEISHRDRMRAGTGEVV